MADYYLRNTLNPGRVIKCVITVTQLAPKEEEGEYVWVIEVGTAEPHKDGGKISPAIAHLIDLRTLDDVVRELTEKIAAQVNWGTPVEDKRPPYVYQNFPNSEGTASIYSNVTVKIKDSLPTAGIDISSISMTVNGFDVTGDLEIAGSPFDYTLVWKPKLRIYDTYGG